MPNVLGTGFPYCGGYTNRACIPNNTDEDLPAKSAKA